MRQGDTPRAAVDCGSLSKKEFSSLKKNSVALSPQAGYPTDPTDTLDTSDTSDTLDTSDTNV
jgi:hypothetical protein